MFKRFKISPYAIAGILVWVIWGLVMCIRAVYYMDGLENLRLWVQVRSIQAINGMWATLILIQIYHRFSRRKLSIFQKLILVLAFSYLFSVGLVALNVPVYRYIFSKSPVFYVWHYYLVAASTKIFVFFCFGIFYFLIQHWQELQQQKEKTLTAIALANEAQLQMLRYQLHPHFLFNALNSIRTLIYEEPKKADQRTDVSNTMITLLSIHAMRLNSLN